MPPSLSSPVGRRSVLAGIAAAGVVPTLSACGQSESDAGGADGRAEQGALPVTIEHKFGTTRITKAPTRVVCVGLLEQDALLALGVAPVGVTEWFGKAPGQIFPWATSDLGDAKLPTVLSDKNGIQVEKIAGLAPDLIIGQYAGLKQADYDKLSKIAPTVAQAGEYVDYGMPWGLATKNIAAAVGRPKAGTSLVSRVQGRITRDRQDNPSFAGLTAVVVTAYEGLYVYGPQDPRSRILTELGFVFPKQLDKPSSKEFGWTFSTEKTPLLDDVDVVVWLNSEAVAQKETGGLWGRTTAAKQGRGVFISEADGDYYVGQSMVTPLSIPYVLDRYVPQLAAAADGRTATKVPSVKA